METTTTTKSPQETSRKPRTVLVTGGSRGIGKAIVKKFAEKGDTVWFTYRTGKAESEQFIKDELPAGINV